MSEIIPSPPTVEGSPRAQPSSKLLTWFKGKSKLGRVLRHLIAILIWMYGIGQLFVFNFDGWLIANLPEDLRWIVIYKLLILLTLAAIIINFVPRKVFWSRVLYVVLYPLTRACLLIVLLGFILYKLRSWTAFFIVINFIFACFANFKFNFLVYVMAVIGMAVATISQNPGNLVSSSLLLVIVVVILVARRLISVFRPSPIFNVYVSVMAWVMDYCRRKIIRPRDLQGVDASQLTLKEFQDKYGQLSTAISLSGICGFLEIRFKEYRASGVAIATYLVGLASLLILITLLLGFANWALFKSNNSAFHVIEGHRFMDFVYYSFEAITMQRTGEIIPVSLGARLISVLEIMIGIILIAGMLLSLVLSIKMNRDDEAIEQAIRRLQQERQRMNRFVEEGFSLPINQAVSVLEQVKGGLGVLIKILRRAQEDTR